MGPVTTWLAGRCPTHDHYMFVVGYKPKEWYVILNTDPRFPVYLQVENNQFSWENEGTMFASKDLAFAARDRYLQAQWSKEGF